MPAPAWEDLGVFFDPAHGFAVPVRLRPADGEPRTILAIFDEPDASAELGSYQAELTGPTITAPARDLAGLRRGDHVEIGEEGLLDVLRGPRPDGTGLATLPLARARHAPLRD